MKKIYKYISLALIPLFLVSILILPIETKAKNIKEFEAEINKYTAELEEKKAKIVTNEAEIAKIKEKISDIENKIKVAEEEMEALQKEIDKNNLEIEKKSNESKKILEYYQVSNGENAYLEYAFGATDITDMIYRLSIVEQLTDYNDKVMKELKILIEQNKKKQVELEQKKTELKSMKEELESEKERINADSASIRETMPSLEEQIKSARANLTYYKNLGCGETEDIQACQYRKAQSTSSGSVPSTNGFYRPMQYGYVVRGMSSYHMGYDLSSSNKSIPIYPVADGQLFFVGYDMYGALIVKIRHNVGGRYIYSTYAHMSSFSGAVSKYINYSYGTSASIENGPFISHNTAIGNMGSTGNSTGPHLHIEMTSCDWHRGGGCSWGVYQNSLINPSRYISFPGSWGNR